MLMNVLAETCASTDFTCQDGQCIANSFLCDGNEDCLYGEDENSPPCPGIHCPSRCIEKMIVFAVKLIKSIILCCIAISEMFFE